MENDLEQIQKMGEALLSEEDVKIICEVESLSNDQHRAYLKGIKTTQFKLNKTIVEQAIQGSKPAQDIAIDLLNKIKMNGGV